MSLLIVGCGYVGQSVVQRIHAQPTRSRFPVYALTRSSERADELKAMGVQPIIGHWLDRQSLPTPPQIRQILVAVAHRPDPVSQLPPDSDQTHVSGLKNLRHWLGESSSDVRSTKLIYLSTTGVYGQEGNGDSVTELTPPMPTRIGPRIALAAEHFLQKGLTNWSSIVLRLAGIYGPGRIPLAQRMKEGLPLAVPRDGYLNLVHVDDIAQAIMWALDADQRQPMYLLSDGNPVLREQFYRYLAGLCGTSDPIFVEPEPSDPKVRRATNKKVDPACFWRESGLMPEFADYRDGLRQSLLLSDQSD